MRKVLVTGGLGFVGSHLVRNLADAGVPVRIFDDAFRGNAANITGYESKVELIHGDIRVKEELVKAMDGVDTVYHLAAINGTRHFYEIPEKVLEVNVKGVIYALEAAIERKVRRFVFSSSSEVYQNPETIPTPETERVMLPDITNPRYSYGGSKIIGELFCLNYGRKYGVENVVVRFHNVYGPNMGYDHVIPELFLKIKQASRDFQNKEADIEIQGSGEETRAFCYVSDTIDGLVLCGEKAPANEVVHIGNDREEVKIIDLVRMMGEVLGVRLNIKQGPIRSGSTPRRCPGIEKLSALGFQPKVALKQGLERTLAWYKQAAQESKVSR